MKQYYRMQTDYYQNQNLFHRPYVLQIQRLFRGYQCRLLLFEILKEKSARKIQKKWADYKAIKVVKILVLEIRAENLRISELRNLESVCALILQRCTRGNDIHEFILYFVILFSVLFLVLFLFLVIDGKFSFFLVIYFTYISIFLLIAFRSTCGHHEAVHCDPLKLSLFF